MSVKLKIIKIGIFLALISCIAACGSDDADPSSEGASDYTLAKRLDSYEFDPASPLIDRVNEAPDFVLSYLEDVMDATQVYTPYTPSDTEMEDIRDYLGLLPESYMETLQERLIAVYFINNWTGSGAADYVFNSDNEVYTYIIVNPEIMRHDVSEWITYRETSCFITDDEEDRGITITVDCGNEYTGLMVLLIHESSHVMDFAHHYTPYVLEGIGQSVSETDFVKGIWTDYDIPVEDADFSMRDYITFYGKYNGPMIYASQASALYEDLENTPFSSLYASQNWAEDFAEYCTWRYFTNRLGQPYIITVSRDGVTEMIYEPMQSYQVRERTGTPLF
ncbi:MAG: hypothetical protein JW944_12600 [Deltaproteobacteria bacterium]|nr:hypothetical protein [Deltaproteobacteria bacterium]